MGTRALLAVETSPGELEIVDQVFRRLAEAGASSVRGTRTTVATGWGATQVVTGSALFGTDLSGCVIPPRQAWKEACPGGTRVKTERVRSAEASSATVPRSPSTDPR